MPPKKWIDKKEADTYSLMHRSFEDPLYNDSDAPDRVLVKTDRLNSSEAKATRKAKYGGEQAPKGETIQDLAQHENEFKQQGRRENEGEAALYGITYDDSRYDYMQHLKPIGQDPDAVFIAKKDKGKAKKGDLEFKSKVELPSELLPSKETVKRTYQDQQNIPDAISGFQPDMDPRLREVLEALEDEEYVDGEDDGDLFSQLVKSGEAEEDEWDNPDFASDEDFVDLTDSEGEQVAVPQVKPKEGEEEWETAFRQFKITEAAKKQKGGADSDVGSDGIGGGNDDLASETMTEMTTASRATKGNSRRRRKMFKRGAMTELSGASMSSSALFRNKGLTFLDDKFEKIEEEYEGQEDEDEDDTANGEFDMNNERPDLESMMDDFLDNYIVEGKHMYNLKKL